MPLTYAGIPLGINTPEIDDWFADYLDLSDLRTVAAWPTAAWNRAGGIPQPNYSRPLRTKLNVWVHPTGAARWSYGYFITDGKSLKKILTAVQVEGSSPQYIQGQGVIPATGPNSIPQPLVMQAGSGTSRTFQAYLLPVRLISASSDMANPLYLLPLVDERYYWQHQTYGNVGSRLGQIEPADGNHCTYSIDGTLNWSGLLGVLQTYITDNQGTRIVETDTANANYLKPDPIRFNQASYQNFALLIDVLAHSTGRRLVADPFYQLVNFTTSTAQRNTNFANQKQNDAGALQTGILGENALNEQATTPQAVNVAFRAYYNGIAVPDFERSLPRYVVSSTPGDFGEATECTIVYQKTIRSTALADFTDWATLLASPVPVFSAFVVPNNNATLDTLGQQIASDFYQATNWLQDSNVAAIASWQQTGYDDFVEFSMRSREDGSLECKTRIQTCPYNFAMDDLWHYEDTTWEHGNVVVYTSQVYVPAGGWGVAQTMQASDSPLQLNLRNLPISANNTGQPIPSNSSGLTTMKVIDSSIGPSWKTVGIGEMGPPGISGIVGIGSSTQLVLSKNTGTFTVSDNPITALVRRGLCFANENYLIGQTQLGDVATYEVISPSTTCLVQNLTGATIAIGASGTATILAGPLGAEVSTGRTVTVRAKWQPFRNNAISRAQLADSSTADPPGWELQNTEDVIYGQVLDGVHKWGASQTFNVFTGALGSETDTGKFVSAYVRRGIVNLQKTYAIQATSGGYEVMNPTLTVRGQVTADVPADSASSTFTIYVGGFGIETTAAVTISTVYNASSCVIKANKMATAEWVEDAGAWQFSIAHT